MLAKRMDFCQAETIQIISGKRFRASTSFSVHCLKCQRHNLVTVVVNCCKLFASALDLVWGPGSYQLITHGTWGSGFSGKIWKSGVTTICSEA